MRIGTSQSCVGKREKGHSSRDLVMCLLNCAAKGVSSLEVLVLGFGCTQGTKRIALEVFMDTKGERRIPICSVLALHCVDTQDCDVILRSCRLHMTSWSSLFISNTILFMIGVCHVPCPMSLVDTLTGRLTHVLSIQQRHAALEPRFAGMEERDCLGSHAQQRRFIVPVRLVETR